jgi:hypothetical protein
LTLVSVLAKSVRAGNKPTSCAAAADVQDGVTRPDGQLRDQLFPPLLEDPGPLVVRSA